MTSAEGWQLRGGRRGERARFQGNIVLDASRLRRLMARHDPAVYPVPLENSQRVWVA
jgi:hypothetical protein